MTREAGFAAHAAALTIAVTCLGGIALAQTGQQAPEQPPQQTQQPPAQPAPQPPPQQQSAPATNFERSPIGAGFWAFPAERDGNIETACRNGFTIRFADGRSVSLVIEQRRVARYSGRQARVFVESSDTCSFDAAAQVERCTGRLAERGRVGAVSSETRFERDGDRIRAVTTATLTRRNGRRDAMRPATTYPTQCPDAIVHEALTTAFPAP